MKEHPILFNGEMVRAIREDRKTQTRRVVKAGFDCHKCNFVKMAYHPQKNVQMQAYFDFSDMYSGTRFPYGKIGDLLWVRETFCVVDNSPVYFADIDNEGYDKTGTWRGGEKWRPSIHMPRWASRITLEITDVRVERLQEISQEDSIAEGVQKNEGMWCGSPHKAHGFPRQHNTAVEAFADTWNSIYGTWDNNPWMWVLSFKRVEQIK